MRKSTILLLLLCLHMMARGQTTGFLWHYWYDDAEEQITSLTIDSVWHYQADVQSLSTGFHTLYMVVADSLDRLSAPVARHFFKMPQNANGVKMSCLCYVDGNEFSRYEIPANGAACHWLLDMSDVSEGIHHIQMKVVGMSGTGSTFYDSFFIRCNTQEEMKQLSCLCYVDDSLYAKKTITDGSGLLSWNLDMSNLNEGVHRISIQALNTSGAVSTAYNGFFLRCDMQDEMREMTCLSFVDDSLYAKEIISSDNGILHWELDASKLGMGLHRLQVQTISPSGMASAVYNSFFLRLPKSEETGDLRCIYVVDNDAQSREAVDLAQDGTFHFDLDMSSLDNGIHRISYYLGNDKGFVTQLQSRFFIKAPAGEYGITKYEYWLNDSTQQSQAIDLTPPVNPFKLISLLPVPSHPLRSSQFHFEISNGIPMVYAKNDIHVRFSDNSMRFTDVTKQFATYSVKQEVEPVDELQATQTFPKVAENDIRWYTMQVAPGDTAAFKLSQAATLQVFAPSGKEVFKTSESASVQWAGIHTWEDGTYYVAVHDVTGSRSNMTLDYMHMDKYDIVDWDVHTVGNGGCSTITFKGNGFRDLYAVDLYTAAGDSIHSVDISHDSDAETSVTFDFSGAELGVYNAVFHFTQEDKHFANIVTVEEAVDIELATNVTFPSTFLRGTSTTYTIKITNKGNMTAYAVPIYTWIKTVSKDGVKHIKFEGLNLPDIFALTDLDTLNASDIQKLKDLEISLGAEPYFLKSMISSDDNNNDSICIRTNYSCVSIPPYSTRTIQLTIAASETVDVWFTIPDKWMVYSSEIFDNIHRISSRKARSTVEDYYCCYKEHIECFIENVSTACDIVSPVLAIAAPWLARVRPDIGLAAEIAALEVALTGCLSSLTNDGLKTFGITLCESESDDALKRLKEALRAANSASYSVGSILSCVGTVLSGAGLPKHILSDCLSAAGNALAGAALGNDLTADDTSCKKSREKKPGCPPIPPTGGSSTPQPPADPNDIYGYLSDAGSKFMTDEVAKVNYTIEFENDTAFAQASAHTIVIRDTLDSRYFDLKSFLPTIVKIGEREAFLDEATDVKTSGSVTSFLKTIDMRPEINALAQVQGEYSQQTGIAKWTFTSLDPMTMEPTDDLMQGILPVNYNGTSGIGQVMFEVGMKPNKGHGKEIKNRASIVFDYEEAILTPTWVNTVDAIRPVSHVSDVKMLNDSTATVSIEATDELSVPWRYDVYVQYGSGTWFKAAESVPIDTTASVKVYEGINHGFYAVVTDSAGNVEQKNAEREFTFEVFGSQIDTDTRIELAEGWNWMSHNQEEPLMVAELQSAGSRMLGQTEELYEDARFGWMGDLEELLPTQMYKLQMDGPLTVQLSGRLFNAGFRAVPLYEGWNWMGYPVARTMTPAEALAKLEAEEGDMLIGQDGMATYSDGQWTGTLMEMNPGQGYMFRSQSDKNLFLNATAQASSRRANSPRHSSLPDDWTVNKRKYPNVMGMIAQLWHDDALADSGEWQLGAFCGDECRGVAQTVGDGELAQTVLMMNVYGTGSEPISFRVMNRETGEVLDAAEQESFRADVIGSMQQPYALHIGEKTGVRYVTNDTQQATYDLQGRKVEAGQAAKGIYVVADGKKNKTQKVVKR